MKHRVTISCRQGYQQKTAGCRMYARFVRTQQITTKSIKQMCGTIY